MQRYRKLTTICSAAVLSFGLAACGGGGGDGDTAGTPPPPPPPTTYTVALPDGHGLMAGTTMLAHGDTVVGDTTITCPDTGGCVLTVSRDPVTGAYTATATGGQVMVAVAEPPPPPPGPDPVQLAAAQDAARDAWRDARAALAGLAGKESANPAAYQRAVDAVADAKAAYDAALEAMTVAEAKGHQADAEAANQMAMTQAAMVIASYEAPALDRARMAAKSAADLAKDAYDAAKAALDAVESIKGVDMDSYDMAKAKVDAAKAAYDAAKAASDAAAATSVLADAEANQATAEDELDNANTANDDAMKYAGMVQTAEDNALTAAKGAAQTAYNAAKEAYDAAKMRVDDLEDKKADNIEDYVRAMDALVPVKAAYDAAKTANDMAQAATSSTAAEGHKDDVETAKRDVDTGKEDVDRYAQLVETAYMSAQNARDAEDQRQKDVVAARGRAMQSYMDADGDATEAEKAATMAETDAPGSPDAIAARAAATAARTAANAAKAAHDAIMDDMTKAEADAQASAAATAAGTANSQYMIAKGANDTIQTIVAREKERQRVLDVAAVKAAVTAAETAKNAAAKAADDAEQARDDAKDAYDRAMAARTNVDDAKAQYEAAKAAATAARTAADAAETAYMAAMTAAEGIDDATADEAMTARSTAESEQKKAETQSTEAGKQYMAAMDARDLAVAAADARGTGKSLALLTVANAVGIMDNPATANVNEHEEHLEAVNDAIAAQATDVATGETSPNSASVTTAVYTWPYYGDLGTSNVVGGTGAEADTEPGEGLLTIAVTVGGTAYTTTRDNPATTTTDETNFTKVTGLGQFPEAVEISVDTTDQGTANVVDTGDVKTRILVFTDKEQAPASVPARSVAISNVDAVASRINLADAATDLSDASVASYDHDGDGKNPLTTAGVVCPDGVSCSFTIEGGKVTAISGYKVNASGTIAEVLSAEDDTYLGFGVWLQETLATGTNTYTFGAFAGGGSAYDESTGNNGGTAEIAPITGTATYNGSAAGVKSTASGVDYFDADATLTANFGAIDTDAERGTTPAADTTMGTITGMIHNIRVGGVSMDDAIYLDAGDQDDGTDGLQGISAGGAFGGRARMGAGETNQLTGNVSYPFTGTWQGEFFNQVQDVMTTTANEALMPPMSAAGTFGVTMEDDAKTMDVDETTSYVGAFGAHKQ